MFQCCQRDGESRSSSSLCNLIMIKVHSSHQSNYVKSFVMLLWICYYGGEWTLAKLKPNCWSLVKGLLHKLYRMKRSADRYIYLIKRSVKLSIVDVLQCLILSAKEKMKIQWNSYFLHTGVIIILFLPPLVNF